MKNDSIKERNFYKLKENVSFDELVKNYGFKYQGHLMIEQYKRGLISILTGREIDVRDGFFYKKTICKTRIIDLNVDIVKNKFSSYSRYYEFSYLTKEDVENYLFDLKPLIEKIDNKKEMMVRVYNV